MLPGSSPSSEVVLLTGATGYVGGRLLGALERAGTPARCLARRPEALAGRVGETTQVVAGDLLDGSTLVKAIAGASVAYYLVHSWEALAASPRLTAGRRRTSPPPPE